MEVKKKMTIGVVFITHGAKHHLKKCLPPILNSPIKPKVLLVNSSSMDGTVELAQQLGAETIVIPRCEFNHGATREMARKIIGTDIVVMMTPDAYPCSTDLIEKLVSPLLRGEASVSYARQIPHAGADFYESFPRSFNYPDKSNIRSINDIDTYGTYTFFCSDACAAWVNSALDEIDGFFPVLTNEDTFAVARLLQKGHRIAYVSDAIVKHSHRYNLWQEFERHFDTGYVRKIYAKKLFLGKKDENHGAKFVKAMFEELLKNKPFSILYAIIQIGVKFLGYKVGTLGPSLPLSVVKKFSGQDFYWSSVHTTHGSKT